MPRKRPGAEDHGARFTERDLAAPHDGPAGNDSGGVDAGVSTAACTTTFRFVPPAGTQATAVSVTGDSVMTLDLR